MRMRAYTGRHLHESCVAVIKLYSANYTYMRAAMLDPCNARHSSSITARNLIVVIGSTREREINQQQPSELTTALGVKGISF